MTLAVSVNTIQVWLLMTWCVNRLCAHNLITFSEFEANNVFEYGKSANESLASSSLNNENQIQLSTKPVLLT